MPKDSRPNSRLIEHIQLDDGTTLQIWRGAYADELTVRLASSGEELPFLRVACPNFVSVVVLASGPHAEVLGIYKELDGTFEITTNRGNYLMKRDRSGAWQSEWLDAAAVGKVHTAKRKNRNRTAYQRWA